jgi:hypothetical protein
LAQSDSTAPLDTDERAAISRLFTETANVLVDHRLDQVARDSIAGYVGAALRVADVSLRHGGRPERLHEQADFLCETVEELAAESEQRKVASRHD